MKEKIFRSTGTNTSSIQRMQNAKKCVQKLLRRYYDEQTAEELWEKIRRKYCEFLKEEPALGGAGITVSIYDPILIFAWYDVVPDKPPLEEIQQDVYDCFMGSFAPDFTSVLARIPDFDAGPALRAGYRLTQRIAGTEKTRKRRRSKRLRVFIWGPKRSPEQRERQSVGLSQFHLRLRRLCRRSWNLQSRGEKEEQRNEREMTFVAKQKKSPQAIGSLRRRGAGSRSRTGTVSPPADFEFFENRGTWRKMSDPGGR